MMTRKDYIETARILRDYASATMPATHFAAMVREFACMFERDNDSFQRQRFIEACQPATTTKEQ